jgi:hypothetical protein
MSIQPVTRVRGDARVRDSHLRRSSMHLDQRPHSRFDTASTTGRVLRHGVDPLAGALTHGADQDRQLSVKVSADHPEQPRIGTDAGGRETIVRCRNVLVSVLHMLLHTERVVH